MKPFGQDKRPKDWIPFVNFAIVENVPSKIVLRDHLFPYAGAQQNDRLVWGVYGTTSINGAIFSAASFAAAKRCQSLQITTWYRIDDFKSVTTQITRDASLNSGYVHLGRLNAGYRDEIKETWLEWLAKESPTQAKAAQDYSLDELAIQHPSFPQRMLMDHKNLQMIIHPVQQEYAVSQVPMWIATAKADKKRIMASEVRFIPEIDIAI